MIPCDHPRIAGPSVLSVRIGGAGAASADQLRRSLPGPRAPRPTRSRRGRRLRHQGSSGPARCPPSSRGREPHAVGQLIRPGPAMLQRSRSDRDESQTTAEQRHHQNPGRPNWRRCELLTSRNNPTEAGNARNEYFARTPRAPIAPARSQARRSSLARLDSARRPPRPSSRRVAYHSSRSLRRSPGSESPGEATRRSAPCDCSRSSGPRA